MLRQQLPFSETGSSDSGFPTLWRISFRKRWRQKIFRKGLEVLPKQRKLLFEHELVRQGFADIQCYLLPYPVLD